MGQETRRFWTTFALLAFAWYVVLFAMPGASSLVRNADPSIKAETTPTSLALGAAFYTLAVLVIAWPVRLCALRGGWLGYLGVVLLVPVFAFVHTFITGFHHARDIDVDLRVAVAFTTTIVQLIGLTGWIKMLAAAGALWVLRRAGGLSTSRDVSAEAI